MNPSICCIIQSLLVFLRSSSMFNHWNSPWRQTFQHPCDYIRTQFPNIHCSIFNQIFQTKTQSGAFILLRVVLSTIYKCSIDIKSIKYKHISTSPWLKTILSWYPIRKCSLNCLNNRYSPFRFFFRTCKNILENKVEIARDGHVFLPSKSKLVGYNLSSSWQVLEFVVQHHEWRTKVQQNHLMWPIVPKIVVDEMESRQLNQLGEAPI